MDKMEFPGEREMMRVHGTQTIKLPPSAIVSTAIADLQRREDNKAAVETAPDGSQITVQNYRRYASHRRHVVWASNHGNNPATLLARAIEKAGEGQWSKKYETRLLYDDVALLKAALELVAPDDF